MSHAFLPHNGETWLCKADGANVMPLCRAPGDAVALRKFSADRKQFGILDQSHKRTALYRFIDHDPWYEVELLPVTLPRNCLAHDFIIHENRLIVGGHGKDGEALWLRSSENMRGWTSIPLPEGIKAKGKSIDALFIHDGNLVAVDNLVLPKWILLYPLLPTISVETARKVPLRVHTTYESVVMGVEGAEVYALYSRGINHGTSSHHISLIKKSDCTELFSCFQSVNHVPSMAFLDDPDLIGIDDEYVDESISVRERHSTEPVHKILAHLRHMAFSGSKLFLAVGELGLAYFDTANLMVKKSKRTDVRSLDIQTCELLKLRTVTHLEMNPEEPGGLYAVGVDALGAPAFESISVL